MTGAPLSQQGGNIPKESVGDLDESFFVWWVEMANRK